MFFAEQPRLFQIHEAFALIVLIITEFEINFKFSLLRALLEKMQKTQATKNRHKCSGLMFLCSALTTR